MASSIAGRQAEINALINPDPISITADAKSAGAKVVDITKAVYSAALDRVPTSSDSFVVTGKKLFQFLAAGTFAVYALPSIASNAASHVASNGLRYGVALATAAAGRAAYVSVEGTKRAKVISDRNDVAKPLLGALAAKSKRAETSDVHPGEEAEIKDAANLLTTFLTTRSVGKDFAFSKALFNQTLSLLKTHYSQVASQNIEATGIEGTPSVKFSDISGEFESVMKAELMPILAKKLIKEKVDANVAFSLDLVKEMTKEMALSFSNGAPVAAADADVAFKVLLRELFGANGGSNYLKEIKTVIEERKDTVDKHRDVAKLMKLAIEHDRVGNFAAYIAENEAMATSAKSDLEKLTRLFTAGSKVASEIDALTDSSTIVFEGRGDLSPAETTLRDDIVGLATAPSISFGVESLKDPVDLDSLDAKQVALSAVEDAITAKNQVSYERALGLIHADNRDAGLNYQVYLKAGSPEVDLYGTHTVDGLIVDDTALGYDADKLGYVQQALAQVKADIAT